MEKEKEWEKLDREVKGGHRVRGRERERKKERKGRGEK